MNTQVLRHLALSTLLGVALAGCASKPAVSTPSAATNRDTLGMLKTDEFSPQVKVELNAPVIRIGDPIRFRVKSTESGKLWIVEVSPSDKVNVLFPNPIAPDNSIAANTPLDIPNGSWKQELRASAPAGTSTLAFIVTPSDRRLEDVLSISQGKLSKVATPNDRSWGARLVSLQIQEK